MLRQHMLPLPRKWLAAVAHLSPSLAMAMVLPQKKMREPEKEPGWMQWWERTAACIGGWCNLQSTISGCRACGTLQPNGAAQTRGRSMDVVSCVTLENCACRCLQRCSTRQASLWCQRVLAVRQRTHTCCDYTYARSKRLVVSGGQVGSVDGCSQHCQGCHQYQCALHHHGL